MGTFVYKPDKGVTAREKAPVEKAEEPKAPVEKAPEEMTVKELKAELEKLGAGFDTKLKKAELLEVLVDALAEAEAEAEAEAG